MCLVDIVQRMWRMGEVPQEFGWTVLVLVRKGTTDTRGIGLLENLWKVVEALIDTYIRASIQFHDVLHGLWSGRGTGIAILEMNLAQDIAIVDHDPHFLILLNIRKTYDTVDGERLIQTLEGYGAVPLLCGLLETFWAHQKVVPIQNGYHGTALPATWGTMQVGLVSLLEITV